LVSLSPGSDLRYIGPSSGFFFAKLVLACAARHEQRNSNLLNRSKDVNDKARAASALAMDIFQVSSRTLPSTLEHAVQLSMTYFETMHMQYPFLHQPSHLKAIEHVYRTDNPSPGAAFQVNMVMAIAATDLSRRFKLPLSGEGFCANAMKYFDQICVESSLSGLQCLLLLMMYALQSPSMAFNRWYLNYQCIASVVDLGLQRNVKAGNTMSILVQEMRTRVFWVVYSLDRTLGTIMGRPIGLRDEACELRVRSSSSCFKFPSYPAS
jgi:hypothetical protein